MKAFASKKQCLNRSVWHAPLCLVLSSPGITSVLPDEEVGNERSNKRGWPGYSSSGLYEQEYALSVLRHIYHTRFSCRCSRRFEDDTNSRTSEQIGLGKMIFQYFRN